MAAVKGFWGLKGPGRGRSAAALVLGRPGAFFRSILEASHYVEYYDEEMDFEPCRLGVGTETVSPGALERRLGRLGGEWPLLVGYGSIPLLEGPGRRRIFFSPSADRIETAAAGDLVVGLRRGAAPGGGRKGNPAVVTAREAMAAPGRPALPAGEGSLLVIDPLVMDPSLFPVPSNLEPGGLSWHVLTGLLRDLFARKAVEGALVLPCPLSRRSVVPAFVLARLVSKVLAYRLAGKGRGARR